MSEFLGPMAYPSRRESREALSTGAAYDQRQHNNYPLVIGAPIQTYQPIAVYPPPDNRRTSYTDVPPIPQQFQQYTPHTNSLYNAPIPHAPHDKRQTSYTDLPPTRPTPLPPIPQQFQQYTPYNYNTSPYNAPISYAPEDFHKVPRLSQDDSRAPGGESTSIPDQPLSQGFTPFAEPTFHAVDMTYSNHTVLWGAVLVIFSLATFVEQMIKFLMSNPTVKADGGSLTDEDMNFPRIARLISTVCGITLSMAGIGLGLMAFLFDLHKPALTMTIFSLQFILASFVWPIEVFAVPIFDYVRGTGPPYPKNNGWSKEESDAAFVFGTIFCLFSYCSTSLGMILSACYELHKAQRQMDETLFGATLKLRCFSTMVLMFGIGCLVLGGQIQRLENIPRLVGAASYIYPPNFVSFPSIIVMTGCFIICYSTVGIIGTPITARVQAWLAVPMWTWMVTVHILVQVSHLPAAPTAYAFLGGMLGIMSLANILAPAVYCARVLSLKNA